MATAKLVIACFASLIICTNAFTISYPKNAVITHRNIDLPINIDMSVTTSLLWDDSTNSAVLNVQTGVDWPYILKTNGTIKLADDSGNSCKYGYESCNSVMSIKTDYPGLWCDDGDYINDVFRACVQYWNIKLIPNNNVCYLTSKYLINFSVFARNTEESEYDTSIINTYGTIGLSITTSNFCQQPTDTINFDTSLITYNLNGLNNYVVNISTTNANITNTVFNKIGVVNTNETISTIYDINNGISNIGKNMHLYVNNTNECIFSVPDNKNYTFTVSVDTTVSHTGPEIYLTIPKALTTNQYTFTIIVSDYNTTKYDNINYDNNYSIFAILGLIFLCFVVMSACAYCRYNQLKNQPLTSV